MKKRSFVLSLLTFFLFIVAPCWAAEVHFYNQEEKALEKINFFRENLSNFEEKAPCFHGWETLPPLALSDSLNQAAREFLRQAVEELSFSHLLPDGSTPKSRVEETGYKALLVGESLAYLGFENYVSPEEALSVVLDWLLEKALKQESKEAAPFLFPLYQDFGMAMAGVTLSFEGKTYNFYLFCFLFALPNQKNISFIFGRVFDDQDFDGVFIPEEGLGKTKVSFHHVDGSLWWETETFSDGSFCIPLNGEGVLEIEPIEKKEFKNPEIQIFAPVNPFIKMPEAFVFDSWLNLASGGQN